MIKKLTINCKTLRVGGRSPALLHCKYEYTKSGVGYIGLKVEVKGREGERGSRRRLEQRTNK